MRAIITVVGKDRVGIIALVCNALAKHNINVQNISQTVLDGFFTMMMVVDLSGCCLPLLELIEGMEELGSANGLSIRVQREDLFEAIHQV